MNSKLLFLLDQINEPHHWSWYQLNDRSAQENYNAQKSNIHQKVLLQNLWKETTSNKLDIPDVQLIIKSEVRR